MRFAALLGAKFAALLVLMPLPASAAEYLVSAQGRGWIEFDGEGFYHDDPTQNYIVGCCEGYRNWFRFSLAAKDVQSASLIVHQFADFNPTNNGSYTLKLAPSLDDQGLASGPNLATYAVTKIAGGTYIEIPLS